MIDKRPDERDEVSIADLVAVIQKLPHEGRFNVRDGTPSTTKEQWLGWLSEYDTPGYYNRQGTGYHAKFAYNRLSNPRMLLWLAEAAGIDPSTVNVAVAAAEQGKNVMQKAGAVRKCIPWSVIARSLWPNGSGQSWPDV